MSLDELTNIVRGAIFQVYNTLGPGLLESVYETALVYELKKRNLMIQQQVNIPILYEDICLDGNLRIDILVEKQLILEIKSVEDILPVHHKQVLTYLKLTSLKLGLLINFNSVDISKSIFAKSYIYRRRRYI